MASKYPDSYDRDIALLQKDLKLCPSDQQTPGSCCSRSCEYFHMCRDYLLNRKCTQFELNGKCTRSHSFFTLHNQKILEKKYRLTATDENIFEKVSKIIRTSTIEEQSKLHASEKISSRFLRSPISNDDHDVELTRAEPSTSSSAHSNITISGRGRPSLSLYKAVAEPSSGKQSLTNEKRYSISHRFVPPADPSFSTHVRSKSTGHSLRTRPDMIIHSVDAPDQRPTSKRMLSERRSLSISKQDHNNHSSSSDEMDETVGTSHSATAASSNKKSSVSSILGLNWKKKEKNPSISDPNRSVISRTEMKDVFDKYYTDDQLCYLLGPGKHHLIEREKYQILPSGYCRLTNVNEEKELQRKIDAFLLARLNVDCVQLPKDDLALIISTPVAERLFEQNQKDYAIISEPYAVSFDIEVIYPTKREFPRPLLRPSTNCVEDIKSEVSIEREKLSPSSSGGKFHIAGTNSSIDVICKDITQTQVDLLICVSTSMTLLNSVLTRAGHSTASQYDRQSRLNKTILLDGGFTLARKILFVPWELEVQSRDTMKAQNSLSDLVKWCIDQAYQLNMRSIAFPSIGTGQIGLDTNKVCESMISAASEHLHKYKMDVLFVIYPSSGNKHKEQSYQIFRTYLDNLCEQIRPTGVEPSSVTHGSQSSTIAIERSKRIRRSLDCKRIATISHSLDMTPHHRLLVGSLEKLIEEKTYNLSLVQQIFIDQVDLLIDVCLKYHVLPRINFPQDELTLRGDRDSCAQCFTNLRKQRIIHKYTISCKIKKNLEEIKMNTYTSMKIDEAFMNGDSKIRLEDDDRTVFDIDLKNLQVYVNSNTTQVANLYTNQLNADSKISRPKTWSSSILMIQTVEIPRLSFDMMPCVRHFEQTMPKSKWCIERIDAIENWPLYVHFARKMSKHNTIVFHGCSFSSVQSIIHYGLHSKSDHQSDNSICLTRDAFNSHIYGSRRSTDGKYYMFAVLLPKKTSDQEIIYLSNKEAHLALPTHLITYQRSKVVH